MLKNKKVAAILVFFSKIAQNTEKAQGIKGPFGTWGTIGARRGLQGPLRGSWGHYWVPGCIRWVPVGPRRVPSA